MRKFLSIIFTVTWIQTTQHVVQCPGGLPLSDARGATYFSACLTNESRTMRKEFKEEADAKRFAAAMKTLDIGEKIEIKKEGK